MANFMDAIRKTLSENVTVTEVPDQTEESTVDVTELAVSDEPINELSTRKLLNYKEKAKKSETAARKQVDHLGATLDPDKDDYAPLGKAEDTVYKRSDGLKLAHSKIMRRPGVKVVSSEEVEQVDELSKKTLGSYIGKALDKHGEAQSLAGYKIGSEGLPSFRRDADAYSKNLNDRSNTRRGIKTAVKKLTGQAKVNAKEEVITKEETNMNEAAVDTLKPGAMAISDPMSKFEVIRAAIGAMHAMSTDELVKLYNASMAQIGHEADPVGNNAASNRASVAMKPSAAREDVEKMFDGQDLSEEFKSTATTLFEAAVIARAEEEIKNLRALYEETYATQVEELVEELSGQVDEVVSNLTEQLDKYIDYAVESWMEENQVAIESTLRSELTEEFIKDLRNLFVEHNISIPEESVEVVEELASRVEELEAMLNDQIDENINIKNALIAAEIESMVEEAMHGMTLNDQEKFRTMIEAVEFSGDLDDLSEKLQLIKKTYFTEQKKVHSSNIVDETFESDTTSKTAVVDPNIARYVSAIERTTRSKI